MKPVPRYTLIREQAERLLKIMDEHSVNDPIIYERWEGIPPEVDLFTQEFSKNRKWDTVECPINKLCEQAGIEKRYRLEVIKLLTDQGSIQIMSDWCKVFIK